MKHTTIAIIGLVFGPSLLAGCSKESDVSFQADIMPIFERNCLECHAEGGKGEQETDLGLDTYAALMEGTKFGPVVVPGNSLTSVLNQVVEGRVDKSIQMPHGGTDLPADEVAILKDWVDQGAKNN